MGKVSSLGIRRSYSCNHDIIKNHYHSNSSFITCWKLRSDIIKAPFIGSKDRLVASIRKIVLLQVFRDNKIDGGCLPLLTESHLTTGLGLKLGPALKLLTALRLAHSSTQSQPFSLSLLSFSLSANLSLASLCHCDSCDQEKTGSRGNGLCEMRSLSPPAFSSSSSCFCFFSCWPRGGGLSMRADLAWGLKVIYLSDARVMWPNKQMCIEISWISWLCCIYIDNGC